MPASILAIDIGSTKITAAIAQHDEKGLHIAGIGKARAQGIKKGIITNIDLASKSIKEAYNNAHRIAGTTSSKAVVSLSGAYVKSTNSKGVVNIPNKEISIDEINRVMQTAIYNANIPHEYDIIHALPYKFKVDDQDFIEDPLGMNASRLEAEVHIVAAPKSSIFNIKKTLKLSGIENASLVLTSYASAIATLSEEDKELGACIIDMGGSTCNLAIYLGNSLVYDDFLAVGSMHVTNDLSIALHTPLSAAEEIKIFYGDLKEPKNDYIEIPIIGDENQTHQVSLEIVYNVIYARVQETLLILANSIEKSGLKDQIGAGIILTGGFTKLPGLRELASAIFDNVPVRIAKPHNLPGLEQEFIDPQYSTLIGLLYYGAGFHTLYEIDTNRRLRYKNDEDFSDNENMVEEQTSTEIETPPVPQRDLISEKLADLKNMEELEKKKANFFEKLKNLFTQMF